MMKLAFFHSTNKVLAPTNEFLASTSKVLASILLSAAMLAIGCAAPSSSAPEDEAVEVTDEALVQSNRQFIAAVADDIGEYFHYDGSSYAANIVPVTLASLPAALRAKA